MAESRVNRLWLLLAWAIIYPPPTKVTVVGLSWNVIPLSRSCPNEIRFESQSGARATLWSSIVVPPANGMDTVPISSVRMTWPAAVTKSILLARVLLKRRQLLHKWRDAHESRNQGEFGCDVFFNPCSLTMKAVPTGPGGKVRVLSRHRIWLLRLGVLDLVSLNRFVLRFGLFLILPRFFLLVSLLFVILLSKIAEWICLVACRGGSSLSRSGRVCGSCSTHRCCSLSF